MAYVGKEFFGGDICGFLGACGCGSIRLGIVFLRCSRTSSALRSVSARLF
jgi:hypothetical protein